MALTLSLAPLASARCEQDLVTAARRGDDRAFEELYSLYRERIASFILSKVHDHGRAEDIAQEVFISALRRLRASDQEIAFKPWIYEIAKNACIDEFRRAKRAREVSLDADEELSAGRRGLLSIAPTPPAAIESKQKLTDLQGAFGGLSENHHQLLVMREFEGLSYNEIGARTGMSRQVVESTLFRARRKLTEEYDEIASGRRCEQVQALIEESGAQSLRSCGIRQRRQLTRHLAHCQPCRRKARLAGVDEQFVKPRSIAAKIAALLPFPIWRWPLGGGGKGALAKGAAAKGGSAGAGSAAAVGGSSVTLGQAAAAAVALAIAGAGGGAVTGVWAGKPHSPRPVNARNASDKHAGGSTGAQQHSVVGAPGAPSAGAASAHRARAASAHRAAGSGAAHIRVRQISHPAHGRVSSGAGGAARSAAGGSTSGATSGAPNGSAPSGGATASGAPSVGSAASGVSGAAKSAVSGVRGVVTGTVGKVVSGGPSTVTSSVGSTAGKVDSTVGTVTQGAGAAIGGAASKAGAAVGGVASKVGSAVGGPAAAAGSAVGDAATKTGAAVGSTVGKVTSTADAATGKVTSTAAGATGKVTSTAAGATGKVTSTASKLASSVLP